MEALLKLTEDIFVLDIPKNGSSLIKALMCGKGKDANIDELHNKDIGYTIDNVKTFIASVPRKGKVVAIYRDPVERFVSFYTDKVLNSTGTTRYKIVEEGNIHSMDDLISYCENTKNALLERHLKPQHLFIESCFNIDLIVPLDLLSDFISEYTGYTPFIINASKFRFTPTSEQIERIKKLYQKDYLIPETYKVYKKGDKIW